jgi:hypothetical protein
MRIKWLKASKVLVFGGPKNHRTPVRLSSTRGIKHWYLSGYPNIPHRIKFFVTRQESSPQSATPHAVNRWQPISMI